MTYFYEYKTMFGKWAPAKSDAKPAESGSEGSKKPKTRSVTLLKGREANLCLHDLQTKYGGSHD